MEKTTLLLTVFLILSSLSIPWKSARGEETFSRDRALEHLRYIAETIGPRPLGSPQEKAALAYFAERLAEYGCEVDWQAVTQGSGEVGKSALNTASFNVIGRLPGMDKREIIIGAHIDSSSPEIPGANDDGSGVATIIELANVLSQETHTATLVFVAFCGEESGLIGSKSFVEQYPLENVALMLQLDMDSDDSPLMLWVDTTKTQTPAWLVAASIDAFHSLGYRNIDYPTFFQSLNNAFGGAGSDHQPFMEKGIPAIAFVSDITFPIHTPNDTLEYFEPAGLERSGRLIRELVRKFDQGQPEEKAGHYMLILVGEKPLFVPLLWLRAFIVLSLLVGLAAFLKLYRTRKLRVSWDEEKKIKKSWPKLLIINAIIIVTMFFSLWLMQLVSGQRTPWYAHPGPYFPYAFLFFIFGVWLGLQLTRKWRLRRNPFFYFVRASLYLTVLTAIAWLASGPRLALFPAAGLLFLSLACLVPWGWLRGLFWVLAPFWIFRMLILSEYYKFGFRASAMSFAALKSFLLTLVFWAVLVLFFVFWTMPFLLGFAAVYRSSSGDLLGMKRFRKPFALIPIGILIIGGAFYLKTLPAYDGPWEQEVTVTQKRDAENKTAIEFTSSGYLRGIRADIDGREEVLDERTSFRSLDWPLEMDWLKEEVTSQTEDRATDRLVRLNFQLDFEKPPYGVTLRLKSDRLFTVEKANVRYRHQKNRAMVAWSTHPPQVLQPKMELILPREAKLEAEIVATFLETPLPVSCQGKNMHFIHRAELKRKVDLLPEK
ncbi:MAG TPA: M28 family peptidase [Candidatus Desulfaltia sp.]|nr:M28 family peptidase [Candidatus Desulfaltia sp.]